MLNITIRAGVYQPVFSIYFNIRASLTRTHIFPARSLSLRQFCYIGESTHYQIVI